MILFIFFSVLVGGQRDRDFNKKTTMGLIATETYNEHSNDYKKSRHKNHKTKNNSNNNPADTMNAIKNKQTEKHEFL